MTIFFKLIKLVRPVLPTMLLALLLAWCSVASSISLMAAAAYLIASAALHPFIYELSLAIVGVRFFGISRAIFRYTERYVSHDATFQILTKLRVWCYQKIEPLAPAKLNEWQSGEIFSLLIHHIDTLKDFYLRVLAPPIIAFTILAALGGILCFYIPTLALLLSIAFLTIGIAVPMIIYYFNKRHSAILLKAQMQFKSNCIDLLIGITELIAFNYKTIAMRKIANNLEVVDQQQNKVFRINSCADASANFIANFTIWCMLILLIPMVHTEQISGVTLAVLTLALQSSFEAVLVLPAVWHYYAESMAAAKQIFHIIESDTPVRSVKAEKDVTLDTNFTLDVKELNFSYPNQNQVLHNLSFSLKKGDKIAIVGTSGAGKSTLINVLLRFWEYQSGSVKLGDIEYKANQPENIRQHFNVVAQHTHIFHTTLEENLRLANPHATPDDISRVIEQAELSEFVNSLPDGLQTNVGQNGKLLSGGQRQRLAIARALLRPAPILLLDEPTTGLDAITERNILHTIEHTLKAHTILLITHRLVGLENMQQIFVMENGKFVEQGTFQELMQKQAIFYQMYNHKIDF
ncbi:thiol reductant ABC exporter subunit CydC [Anaerosinus massiliensis]|uniref:thiol reductant ABC exporter subunit CydC n=1 Tax=Massilibacillus massiliensis TaxID=1806837 RepID=UPI000B2D82A5|nr:thiol reductant ABC exporter subunit CydC [Massilibacillus massiliensis]